MVYSYHVFLEDKFTSQVTGARAQDCLRVWVHTGKCSLQYLTKYLTIWFFFLSFALASLVACVCAPPRLTRVVGARVVAVVVVVGLVFLWWWGKQQQSESPCGR